MFDVRPQVVLRADGQFEKGYGHLSRVLAIGEALQDEGFQVELIGDGFDAVLPRFSVSAGSPSSPTPAKGTAEDATQIIATRPDFIVVDGYHFNRDFFRVLESSEIPFLVIDDGGQTTSSAATMVVNQSPGATPALYSHFNGRTELLLGPQYCLIRKEFEHARELASARQKAGVFVNFGASDPTFLTEPVLDIVTLAGLSASVALGPGAAERKERLLKAMQSGVAISEPTDFATGLASSELAVIAGGTTTWEAAYLGVPIIAMIVADNQRGPVLAANKARIVDWVIDTYRPEKRWQSELERALIEFKKRKRHYLRLAASRTSMVGNLGTHFLATQIRRKIS